ncbi:helix-turn-helix domain-containing protein [Nocardioides caldifontis]|uniref:helix-turn-helix domain-containing protein n=1 Tax=Nocardioides caldifontis TaxID=2588938 RepID=UPI001EF1594C|nr:GAF domain-containing protein [Nocardioides caldifontis]
MDTVGSVDTVDTMDGMDAVDAVGTGDDATGTPDSSGADRLRPWLEAIADIATALNGPASLPEVLDLVAETAANLLGYDFCAVLLPAEDGESLLITGSHGLSPDYVRQVNADRPVVLTVEEGVQAPSSKAFLTGESVQVPDTIADAEFLPWGGVAREQGYRSMISVPVEASGVRVGTLNCYTRVPHLFGEEEQELLALLADQAGVAIQTARLRDREASTIEDLLTANTTLAEQHELLRRGEAVHEQLTQVALRGGGVTGVAASLADLLGTTVVVTEEPSGVELARAERSDVRFVPQDADAHSTPVLLGQDTVARIWVSRSVLPLSALDVRALEHAATVSALEVLRARTALEVEWRLSGEIVTDLLAGNPMGLVTAGERAARLGIDLGSAHAVLVVQGGGRRSAAARVLSVARSHATRAQPPALVGTVAEDVVLLWPGTEVDEVVRSAGELQRQLVRLDLGTELAFAVSPLCTSLGDYPAAYRRARGAATVARLRGQAATVASFGSLGLYGLLLQLEDVAELRRFADEVLAPVRNHDAARGTALEETLRAYLAHDLNTAATAASLFVHPNTVGLRIRKVEQLLGISTTHVRSLAELTVALGADEVADALAGPQAGTGAG